MENNSDMPARTYRVAGVDISVFSQLGIDLDLLLPSFKPFMAPGGEAVLRIGLSTATGCDGSDKPENVIIKVNCPWGGVFNFNRETDGYSGRLEVSNGKETWFIKCSSGFDNLKILVPVGGERHTGIISWLIMIIFAQRLLDFGCIMLHASAVIEGGKAYAFAGKSGTGKSTHSQIWCNAFYGARMLNDDNPILRLSGGNVFLHGSPWSGKTACYLNVQAPLAGIAVLRQARNNRFVIKHDTEAVALLLPSCSALRQDDVIFGKMLDILISSVGFIKIGELECLPNENAAYLCRQNLKNN